MVQIQFTTEATHFLFLESLGQAWSAGSECNSPQKLLTSWRAEDRHCQQCPNAALHRSHSPTRKPRTGIVSRVQKQHRSHSLPGEPKTGAISRVQIQLTTEVTYSLESQEQSAGSKCSKGATHFLESQGQASLAGSVCDSPWKPLTSWRDKRHHKKGPNSAGQPLTNWRDKDRHHHQSPNAAQHECHLQTGEWRIDNC